MKRISISVLALATSFFSVQIYAQQKDKEDDKAKQIDEVIVTALGIKRNAKSLGYAQQNVKSEEIEKAGKSSVMDALSGKVAGVQITASGGQAGSGTNVVIRGYGSITGNNQPLYVVDGVPIDDSVSNIGSSVTGAPNTNRSTDINPDDVESVTILKGGAASALYGIQARNGIVMITTKKGKAGKTNYEFSSNISIDQANKFPALSDKFTTGNAGIFNAATTNQWGPLSNSGAVYPNGIYRDIDGDGTLDNLSGKPIIVYKDNYKRFFQTGNTMKYNLAVSGGNEKSTFMVSGGYFKQDGIVPNQTYDRKSVLVNGTYKLSPKLDVDYKFNYINTGGLYFNASQISENLGYFNNNYDVVNFPYQDALGNKTYWHPNLSSPMWTVNKTGENRNVNRFISHFGYNYHILPKLTLSHKIGLDYHNNHSINHNSIGTAEFVGTDYKGDIQVYDVTRSILNSDIMLRYNMDINDDNTLTIMAGNNMRSEKYENAYNKGTSFILPNLLDITNTEQQSLTHNSGKNESLGVFGELSYSYKNLFFLTGTARNDWDSRLAAPGKKEKKLDFFYPSISAAIVFSDLMNTNAFYGKLRGSYAVTSNVPDSPYLTSTVYEKQNPNYYGYPRYSLSNFRGNPDIRPEKVYNKEIGLELGVLKNKIYFDATYYQKNTIDAILRAPVSVVTGFDETLMNLGKTLNKGIEATLSFNNLFSTGDLKWTSEFNFTRNRGTVVKVGEGDVKQVTLGYAYWGSAEFIAKEGQALGAIYGYDYAHYKDDPTQPILVDPNTGWPIKASEKTILGNVNPDFILGWNTSLDYKGFRFGFTFERKEGGQMYNDFAVENTYSGHHIMTDERYYPGNPNVNSTRVFGGVDANGNPVTKAGLLTKAYYTTNHRTIDSNYVEDTSWWRLRNLYIGYSLPSSVLNKIGISGLEITLSGRNLWLKTPYSGVDPEVNSLGAGGNGIIGLDANSLPGTKSVDFGVKIKL